jgi:hypothetical protein
MIIVSLAVVAITYGNAGEPVKSGLQVGKQVSPFRSLVIVGRANGNDYAGKIPDLISTHGPGPCMLIIAREINDPLTRLIMKLDAEAAKTKLPNAFAPR